MNVRINKWCAVAMLSAALLLPVLCPPASAQTNKAYIGLNVTNNSDYGTSCQLADLMMTSRGWGVLNAPAGDNLEHTTVDSNGWPMTDSSAYVFAGLDGEGMDGTYTLSLVGQATIGVNGGTLSNQSYNSSTNVTTANVTLSGMSAGTTYTLYLNLSNTQRTASSGTGTGVTNVKLMRPGYANSALFTTQFLSLVENFGAIRFMDWLATNGNQQVNWSDRNTPNTYSQAATTAAYGWEGKGSCWEYAVALCNQSNCDMWINIPAMANSDYVSKVAELILYGSDGNNPYTSTQGSPVWAPLNSNLHCYVEFSNEVWNYGGAFSQTPYVVNAGDASQQNGDPYFLGYDGTTASSNGYGIGMRYKAYLAMQMSQIFRNVVGNSNMMTRFRPVFESQETSAAPTLEDPLGYLDNVWNNRVGNYTSTPHPVGYWFYGGGGTGYVVGQDPWDSSTTLTIDQLFNDFFPTAWPNWIYGVTHDAGICAGYGMKRDVYEAGPGQDCANGDSCTVKQSGAFNDPRIAGVCSSMVTMWDQGGGDMYMHFNGSGNETHGLLNNGFDTTSYKLQGMQAAAAATRSAVTYGVSVPGSVNAGSYEFSNDGYSGPSTNTTPVNISGTSYYNYTINVGASGSFTVGVTGSGGTTGVFVDGASAGSLALPTSSTVNAGTLGVGLHSIRLTAVSGTLTVSTIIVSGGGSGAPGAPSGLTAAGGNAQVALTWTAGSGATSYNVYRGTTTGGESGTAIVTGVTSTNYTNTGLTNGTTYYYTVKSVNSSGTSGASNEASATPTTGAPGAPSGLTGAGGNAQVALSWTAGSGATSYNVYRGTTAGGESGTAIVTGVTVTNYTNTGLTNGTTYYFTVKSVNSSGTSGASNEASATPTASTGSIISLDFVGSDTSMGASESAGVVAATNWNNGAGDTGSGLALNYSTGSSSGATAAWSSADDWSTPITNSPGNMRMMKGYLDDGTAGNNTVTISGLPSAITSNGYDVYIYCDSDNGATLITGGYTIGSTTIDATDSPNTNFSGTFTQASNSAGNYVKFSSLSAASFTLTASPVAGNRAPINGIQIVGHGGGGAPSAPTGLTATPGNAQVALSWTASSGATSYNVLRGTTSGSGYAQVANVTTTSYTNSGLTNGTTYYFVVAAVNSSGTSANSSQASAAPVAPPAAPTGLTPTPGNAQAALAWNSSTGATSYNVLRSTTSGSGYAQVTNVTTTSYTNTGLTNGATYYFVVAAINAGGTSANSSQASATPVAGTNLVQNPGYETGTLPNFWLSGGTAAVSTTSPHSGTYCAYEAGAYSSLYQNLSGLTANHTYTVTVWAKLSGTTSDTIDVYATNFGGTKVTQNVTATSWTQLTFTFTTGSSTTTAQVGVEDQDGSSVDCYVDDWTLE